MRFTKQQSRVYRWETQYLPIGPNLSVEQMQKFTQGVYESLGLDAELISTPRVYKGRGGHASWWHEHRRRIGMNQSQAEVIIHEVAHALNTDLYLANGARDGNHGPIFVRIMLELNERYQDCTLNELIKSARMYGIKVYNKQALCWLPESSSGPSF